MGGGTRGPARSARATEALRLMLAENLSVTAALERTGQLKKFKGESLSWQRLRTLANQAQGLNDAAAIPPPRDVLVTDSVQVAPTNAAAPGLPTDVSVPVETSTHWRSRGSTVRATQGAKQSYVVRPLHQRLVWRSRSEVFTRLQLREALC